VYNWDKFALINVTGESAASGAESIQVREPKR